MKPSGPEITLPEFPGETKWLNVPHLPARTLLGRSVPLVWFWDFSSLNALRSLPYLVEWHRRYSEAGLRVIGVHSPQFDFGRDRPRVEDAVRMLGIEFAVAPDPDFAIWKLYGNEVWPSLYLWDRQGTLRHYHHGEGAYEETELAIQELLQEIDEDVELPPPMAPLRRTDRPGALVQVPTPHRYLEEDRSARPIAAGEELSVRYSGTTAAAVLDGDAPVDVYVDGERRRTLRLNGPRMYKLFEAGRHEEHEVRLEFRGDARAYAFSFAPGPAD